ncbi:MAG TPA: DNA repair protein RadC [Patescibacteria group bacterium]|nr:DNA repair protein RadC [Patescibacteria group bacterium]
MKLKDRPLTARPREKLLTLGPSSLTTEELFMVILGSGTIKCPIMELAQKVERCVFDDVQKVTYANLATIPGVGISKACAVLAAVELGNRIQKRGAIAVTSPSIVQSMLHHYASETKEYLLCLYLDTRYHILHTEVIAVGSLNHTSIYPRDVFTPIKYHPVAAIILVHNHPSGNPLPSDDDVVFTKSMKKAADMLGIELADHVILAHDQKYSLKEHGYIAL